MKSCEIIKVLFMIFRLKILKHLMESQFTYNETLKVKIIELIYYWDRLNCELKNIFPFLMYVPVSN